MEWFNHVEPVDPWLANESSCDRKVDATQTPSTCWQTPQVRYLSAFLDPMGRWQAYTLALGGWQSEKSAWSSDRRDVWKIPAPNQGTGWLNFASMMPSQPVQLREDPTRALDMCPDQGQPRSQRTLCHLWHLEICAQNVPTEPLDDVTHSDKTLAPPPVNPLARDSAVPASPSLPALPGSYGAAVWSGSGNFPGQQHHLPTLLEIPNSFQAKPKSLQHSHGSHVSHLHCDSQEICMSKKWILVWLSVNSVIIFYLLGRLRLCFLRLGVGVTGVSGVSWVGFWFFLEARQLHLHDVGRWREWDVHILTQPEYNSENRLKATWWHMTPMNLPSWRLAPMTKTGDTKWRWGSRAILEQSVWTLSILDKVLGLKKY